MEKSELEGPRGPASHGPWGSQGSPCTSLPRGCFSAFLKSRKTKLWKQRPVSGGTQAGAPWARVLLELPEQREGGERHVSSRVSWKTPRVTWGRRWLCALLGRVFPSKNVRRGRSCPELLDVGCQGAGAPRGGGCRSRSARLTL